MSRNRHALTFAPFALLLAACAGSIDAPAEGRTAEASQAITIVQKIEVGYSHVFTIADGGDLFAWGYNGNYELGLGDTTNRVAPEQSSLLDVADVDGYGLHTCAATEGGAVYCWGHNGYNKVGSGSWYSPKQTPTAVSGITDAVAVATGWEHSCALLSSGEVVCWGQNSYGQLGHGSSGSYSASPVTVSNLSDAISIDAGAYSTCALRATGKVVCWGDDWFGQLGNGSPSANQGAPVEVLGIDDVVKMVRGQNHGCALLSSGEVKCWGANNYGQLGLGSGAASLAYSAELLSSLSDIVDLGAGNSHTCAIRSDNEVFCWGLNDSRQLGDGTTTNQSAPTQITNATGAIKIDGGQVSTCALFGDGVKCWGGDSLGQLGNGAPASGSSSTPVDVVFP
ncbi:RCC1 domain-containing protein [Polyangium mundeleinium]|uniref:BNR repeat domain protein n=1 Tax=Polyangium mundeleinium TaxID=2995306 RepID=A0ABT5EE95_9BACT|nr:hypothetical protein [Polyangium mundeleinium]MDC0740120.1 hypothetical protein [Polyangium mundeleinium]